VRRVDLERGVVAAGDCEAARCRCEVIDRILRARKAPPGDTKFILAPKMHASLVANLHDDVEVIEEPCRVALNALLGRCAQVVAVEVEQVIVEDSGISVAPRQTVPDGLKDRAGRQPPVRHAEAAGALQDHAVIRVLQNELEKLSLTGNHPTSLGWRRSAQISSLSRSH
jgi:hypothetical protein